MNIFTDELMYQYITTGTFIFVINTFLLYSCVNAMTSNAKEELQSEDEIAVEDDVTTEDEEVDDNNNLEEDQEDEEDNEDEEEEDEEVDEDEEIEDKEEEQVETNILNTGEQDSHVYKGFNLMTKKQLIRFVGKEHTYKNKNELIIIAINKFILISIDRVDSIPVFVRNYIKNS
jgi:hypothetical protein